MQPQPNYYEGPEGYPQQQELPYEYERGYDQIENYGSIIKDLTETEQMLIAYELRLTGKRINDKKEIVKDENITFDYSATDPQTTGFVNGTYTSSASATILTFLQMVNPDMPHNNGMIRPIKIIIPEGTILNAKYPAATTFGNHLCPPNADAIIKALSKAIP